MSTRSLKTTQRQYNIMVDFISSHKEMIKSKLSPQFTAKRRDQLWDELTILLNSDGMGPKKSSLKWRRTWTYFKSEVKNKVAEHRRYRNVTGGGSQTEDTISPLHEKAASLIGKTLIEGDKAAIEGKRICKSNSPKPSTSHNNDEYSEADAERNFIFQLEYQDDDSLEQEDLTENENLLIEQENLTEKEDQQETSILKGLTMKRKGSTQTPKSKKKKQILDPDVDVKKMIDAELQKALAIQRLTRAVTDRNVIEDEKAQLLKEQNKIEDEKAQLIKEQNKIEAEKVAAFKEFVALFSSFVNK